MDWRSLWFEQIERRQSTIGARAGNCTHAADHERESNLTSCTALGERWRRRVNQEVKICNWAGGSVLMRLERQGWLGNTIATKVQAPAVLSAFLSTCSCLLTFLLPTCLCKIV